MIELGKETVTVRGYLQDAKMLLREQIDDKIKLEVGATLIVEVAKMLQHEHNHLNRKKPEVDSPTKAKKPAASKEKDPVSVARRNPKLPPMVPEPEPGLVVEAKSRRSRTAKRAEPVKKAKKTSRRR